MLLRRNTELDPNAAAFARRRLLGQPEAETMPLAISHPASPNPLLTRNNGPIEAEPAALTAEISPRATQPLIDIPSEAYPVFNNRGKPIGAEGGLSSLARNEVLLEAQQNYKAPFSWKDLGLSALRGFIGGGLPGAVVGSADYGLNQDTRNAYAVGGDLRRTQNAIDTDLNRQRVDSQMMAQQAQLEALKRKPLEDAQKLMEQERDNLRQVYNSQPYFDPEKNPQHKAIAERAAMLGLTLPTRDEKDDSQLEWINGALQRVSRSGRRVPSAVTDLTGQPLVRQTDVPVVEDGLPVTPREALAYRGQLAQRDTARTDLVGTRNAERQGLQIKLSQIQTEADVLRKQIAGLDAAAGGITTNAPLTKVVKKIDEKGNETFVTQPVVNADNSVAYDTKTKTPERLQYEEQRVAAQKRLEDLERDWKDTHAKLQGIYTPILTRTPGAPEQREDPQVRAYAEKYFGGNYEAAQAAIRKQRGQ